MLLFNPLPEPLNTTQPYPAQRSVTATGTGYPCRRCLHDAQPGDTLFLLPYNPFPGTSPYTSDSPIYVHRDPCQTYICDGSVPEQQRKRQLAVRAYDAEHMMVDFHVLDGAVLAEKAETMLADPKLAYLLVYYAGPGCFAVRVDRRVCR